ncbi:MAG: hypothetical protein U5S82_11770 [Gammaproteobacteria bacterium]|nr:hypothetical protein [Gammaproteobacteria bacterium]
MSVDLVAMVDRLRGLPTETEWLEFKRNRYDPQEIGAYLFALANAACLANQLRDYLVFGISRMSEQIIAIEASGSSKAEHVFGLFINKMGLCYNQARTCEVSKGLSKGRLFEQAQPLFDHCLTGGLSDV